MSILLSLGFLFTMIMSFCKKSLHSFLGFANSKDNGTVLESPGFSRNIPSPVGGLSLVSLPCGDIQRPANVTNVSSPKRDPGGIGFLDDVGGSVNGLMSCTESLGFESSDERRVDDRIDNLNHDEMCLKTTPSIVSRWKKTVVAKSEVKKFPPPLSSLNHNGKPTFFLRPVRKDGRLELMEVKIERPEILHASRQDGRLRLHLIRDEDMDGHEEEEEEEEEEELQEDVEEKFEEDNKEQEEEKAGEWRFPATSGGGDGGLRRCHEMVSHRRGHHHHHHHDLHSWRQHCVTIR